MSLEKLVAHAIEGNAIAMQEAFEEEISARVAVALEEKYKKMAKESDDEDYEDEDEDEDEEMEEGKKKKGLKEDYANEIYKKMKDANKQQVFAAAKAIAKRDDHPDPESVVNGDDGDDIWLDYQELKQKNSEKSSDNMKKKADKMAKQDDEIEKEKKMFKR